MIQHSELILNSDGSIFHLHLKPENIANRIILVGDQARVDLVASFFSSIEFSVQNREFRSVTGWYNGQRLSVISTGIGTGNIDIVINELDALVNIDLEQRKIKEKKQSLELIRIGTSGSLQADIPINSYIVSEKSLGFDSILDFYRGRDQISDMAFENAFKSFTKWKDSMSSPYVVDASQKLLSKFRTEKYIGGATISAPGFYGPQGRVLRIPLSMPSLNEQINQFQFQNIRFLNFEMESSLIYGLAKMLGHHALTICLIIANRATGKANENYREAMQDLIESVLNTLTE